MKWPFAMFVAALLLSVILLAGCQIVIQPPIVTPSQVVIAPTTTTPSSTGSITPPSETTATATPQATNTSTSSPTSLPPTATPQPPTPTPKPKPKHPTPTPFPKPPFYEMVDSPEHVIASYINAINRREFKRAYSYWANPPSTYKKFVRGFADTAWVMAVVRVPLWEEGAAGTFYTTMPTMLLAIHKDGSRHVYHVCYTLSHVNPDAAGEPTPWEIWNATTKKAKNANGWAFLKFCPDDAGSAGAADEDWYTPERMITNYIAALDAHDYSLAYDFWEYPTVSRADYIKSAKRIKHIEALIRLPVRVEGAAGSMYAKVPAMLLITYKNGKKSVYRACYTVHAINPGMTDNPYAPPDWHITRRTIQKLKNANVWQLKKGCK